MASLIFIVISQARQNGCGHCNSAYVNRRIYFKLRRAEVSVFYAKLLTRLIPGIQ